MFSVLYTNRNHYTTNLQANTSFFMLQHLITKMLLKVRSARLAKNVKLTNTIICNCSNNLRMQKIKIIQSIDFACNIMIFKSCVKTNIKPRFIMYLKKVVQSWKRILKE